jgi:hypothetical protein
MMDFLQVKMIRPILVLCDNQSAIASANSPICSAKSRHVKVCYHYVRELIRDDLMRLEYVTSQKMLADVFTKALPAPVYRDAVMKILHFSSMGSVAIDELLINSY